MGLLFAVTIRPEVHSGGLTSQHIIGLNVWGWALIVVVAAAIALGLLARQRRRRTHRRPG